jgi:hypothetical protein
VTIDILNIHRDSKTWENPHTFDPDRWQEDRINKIKNVRYSHIPVCLYIVHDINVVTSLVLVQEVVSVKCSYTRKHH